MVLAGNVGYLDNVPDATYAGAELISGAIC
jgi:hypothetical protein